jgi:hypothetical protein
MRWVTGLLLMIMVVTSTGAQGLGTTSAIPFAMSDVNLSHPLARGLVLWNLVVPPLAGGLKWYALIGQIHPTLVNTGAGGGFQPSTRSEWAGQITLDGVNDYVDTGVAAGLAFPNTTFTAMGWFSTTAIGATQNLLSQELLSAVQGAWTIRIQTSGAIRAYLNDSVNGTTVRRESVSTVTANTWFHVAGVFTTDTTTQANNDVAIYFNGVLDQTAPTTGANPYGICGCNLQYGLRDVASNPFGGSLNDIRIYNRGVPASEIMQIVKSGPPFFGGLLNPPYVLEFTSALGTRGGFFSFFP